MTSAAPLKPTRTALKALFFTAFTEFLLNISAFLEVSITSIRFIVIYRKRRSQAPTGKNFHGRVINAQNTLKISLAGSIQPLDKFIDSDTLFIESRDIHENDRRETEGHPQQ